MADLVDIGRLALVALGKADEAIGKGKDQILGRLSDRLARGDVVVPIRDKHRHLRALKAFIDAADGLGESKETAPDGFGFDRIDLDDARTRAGMSYDRLREAVTFGDLHAALQGSYSDDGVREAIADLERGMRDYDEPAPAPSP